MIKFLVESCVFLLVLSLSIRSVTCQLKARTSSRVEPVCDSTTNCLLPLCKCSNTEIPGNMDINDTPMMIALTFNGVLPTDLMRYLKKILNPIFKNPNGCPVQSTFFISDRYNLTTDYCVVQSLFNNNNEIGVGSKRYTCPYTNCESEGRNFRGWTEDSAEKEVYDQKKRIAKKARINHSYLRGFRIPYLDQKGSNHYRAIKKYAFNYDSSVIIKPNDIIKNKGFRLWPHTLDFVPNYSCSTCPPKIVDCKSNMNCTTSSIWIVPMHYYNAEGRNSCPTLIKDEVSENRFDNRECMPLQKLTKDIIYQQLIENFKRHYETNKAPFIINIENSWFDKHSEMLTSALIQFVNDLTNPESKFTAKNDIYFVTVSKIIEWIKYPASLDVISSKWLWDCDGANYDYDEECISAQKLREVEELEQSRKKNKTDKLELQTEILFHNGVLTVVIVLFIISILFTILYDKYG